MKIDTPTYVQRAQATMRGTTAVTSAASTGAVTASGSEAAPVGQADFTNMTRKDLFDWMNARIRSGEMSLDDSSGLLGMTMKVPVNGGSVHLDNQDPVNFVQLAQDGIRWGRENHNESQVKTLQTALTIMHQHQGEPMRVNLTA